MKHFHTAAIHAGRASARDAARPHAPPIDLSSTYSIPDLDSGAASLGAWAEGHADADNPIYGRLSNPTVAGFENALAVLERAPEAVAFASGMGAITACLMAARLRGAAHVVAVRPLYGGTDHLLTSQLTGLRVSWATADPDTVRAAIRPDTGLVVLESPANPTVAIADIAAIARAAGDVPLLVDSTFATPVLQNPLELGASLVLHSATKFLGGHGDAVGGIVAANRDWCAALRQVRIATGAILHPLAGYLFHRGLQTLALRVERAQETARKLAVRLREHPAVGAVYFPEFTDDWASFGRRQMAGPGTLISFDVHGGRGAARQLMASLRLLTPAVSLGSVDTLIQHPASLTHQIVSDEGKAQGGISESLLRLSVGLEDVDDLWNDLSQALPGTFNAAHAAGF